MRMFPRNQLLATLVAQVLGLTACGDRGATTTVEPRGVSLASRNAGMIRVCHGAGRAAQVLDVPNAGLRAHLAHGDYVARFIVEPVSDLVDDGVHFSRITDAVLAARAVRVAGNEDVTAKCRITIDVAAGNYVGSFDDEVHSELERFPLIIDVPDVTLRGALSMEVDERGRPTGVPRDGKVSALVPDRPLVFLPTTEAIVVVTGHPGGSAGNRAVIEGFTFRSGRTDNSHGGMGIIALRARDLVIRGNRFESGLSSAGDLRSSSATVEANYARMLGQNCGFCFAGGEFVASDNRLIEGGLGGIYVSAALAHMTFSLGANPVTSVEPDVLPSIGSVKATLRNNDIRGHARLPIGFAVRILAVGPASSQIAQQSRVILTDNKLVGNTFGLIVDAGFPAANTVLKGDLDVRLSGNSIVGSCQANLLVGFTRHTGSLGLTTNPYLRSSTYRLSFGEELDWNEAWFAHPAGLGNDLIVNGSSVANGIHHAFDQGSCPGLAG